MSTKEQKTTEEIQDDGQFVGDEILPTITDAMQQIEKAQIDVQIATAHKYPRSLKQFKDRALSMVTMDEETAMSCIYRRPVGKQDGVMQYAEGKSIRMAEIVGSCYGNLRVADMLIEIDPDGRYVKARGMAHDLESNFAASSEVIESTVTRYGKPFSERMRFVVAKACLAKARRDAIFKVVPPALCKELEIVAKETFRGKHQTMKSRKDRILEWITKLGIESNRVWNALGIKGIEDVTLEHLEKMTGIRTAIQDGDTTVDEAFPEREIMMPQSTDEEEGSTIAQGGRSEEATPEQGTGGDLQGLLTTLTDWHNAHSDKLKGKEKEDYLKFFKGEKKDVAEIQRWIIRLKSFEKQPAML